MTTLAILVFGQLREFELAIPSWKFLKFPFKFDIYLSTWNTTYSMNCDGTFTEIEDVTKERVEKVLGKITDYKIVDEIIDVDGTMKQLVFHLKSCVEMLRNSGKQYDKVILIRPDLWLDQNVDFQTILCRPCPDNLVYTFGDLHKTAEGENVIMDNLFICNMPTALKFLNLKDNNYNIHVLFGDFFVKNGLREKSFEPNEVLVVRSNCRGIKNLSQDVVREKYNEWLVEQNRR